MLLIGLDVDLLLATPVPKLRMFGKLSGKKLLPNLDAEFLSIRVRREGSVVLLSQYEIWQTKVIRETIEFACYNYIVPVRNKDEFELFMDNYHPYTVYSNIPHNLWGGSYSGVHQYADWREAFDLLKEEVPYQVADGTSAEME